MSVQACEGVWRQKCGRYVAVISCEPREGGQRWTDGVLYYADNGTVTFKEGGCAVDLVEYIGPFPYNSQRAPVSRPAETESTTAVAGGVSDDPGQIIYELEQRLAAETKRTEQAQRYISDANEAINEKTAEIERLQTRLAEHGAEIDRLRLQIRESNAHYDRMRLEFTAAQQLRSENQSLTVRLQRAEVAAAEALQKWETTEQVCLRIITALAGVRS